MCISSREEVDGICCHSICSNFGKWNTERKQREKTPFETLIKTLFKGTGKYRLDIVNANSLVV